MTLDEMIAVLEAAKRGEKIEMRHGEYDWMPNKTPTFNFEQCDYRIAPKKTLVEELRDAAVFKAGKALDVDVLKEQLTAVEKERDGYKANSDRYELLREMKLYEMMEYRCLPVPLEDADDWFDAQTDAKIRERYPRATIGADKTGEVG
jgi:hypothetical protein